MGKALRTTRAYILSVLIIGLCLVLAVLLTPILPGQSLFFFLMGVMVCSVLDGLGPGLLAAAIAAICHSYFFQFPRYEWAIETLRDVFELFTFCTVAATLNWFSVPINTSRKRALEALNREKATSQFKDRILAVVAHDLRTPLTTIQMGAHFIDSHDDSAETKNSARRILNAVDQMKAFIQDLLDADRIKTNHFGITLGNASVQAMLQEVLALLEPLASKKSLTLKLDASEGLFVNCDRNRIIQVLSNILGNAIKFTPRKGMISISAHARGAKIEFVVSDTGSGILPEDLPHIFDLFWRKSDQLDGSTGLGLSIARSIIELHGETIHAFSEPGHGSRFVFTLPAAAGATAVSEAA